MMYAHFGWGAGSLFGLFHLFCLSFGLGLVLFVVWAVKALNKKELKKLVTWLLAVGLVGMILSGLLVWKAMPFYKDGKGWKTLRSAGTMEQVMDEMMGEVAE